VKKIERLGEAAKKETRAAITSQQDVQADFTTNQKNSISNFSAEGRNAGKGSNGSGMDSTSLHETISFWNGRKIENKFMVDEVFGLSGEEEKIEMTNLQNGMREILAKQVSERSERALMKTSILAVKCAKWLHTATSTTKLTHPIRLARSFRSCSVKNAHNLARRRN